MADKRRLLPSVDGLLREPELAPILARAPREMVVRAAREAVDAARRLRSGPPENWAADIAERIERRAAASLRPVLNATGVVLHTNLGRAPLAPSAIEAVHAIAGGYSALEYDLHSGTRGHRADHCRRLLSELTGAEDGLVVNNAAGALVLALNALAKGRPVLISRGELIEIGGAFRIPEIMEKSGAVLHEIGTTNRTHLDDYRRGLEAGASAILTVHRSNFEQVGFVHTPTPLELARLAHEFEVPYIYDVGSGLLADLSHLGLTGEPRVQEAVESGADLVLFSGDKLLGGPQAGCLAGTRDLIHRCRQNPFARALRADKMTLAALEATLALYRDPAKAAREIPVLAMLHSTPETMKASATMLARHLPSLCDPRVIPGFSAVGGGSFPNAKLATFLVVLSAGALGSDGLALRLRIGSPSVITRIHEGHVVLDPRTLPEATFAGVAEAVHVALSE
ncbi:MAG: L-seryl-tRNA(Sec) selenium transferase [Gemmatimonadota bacterium]